MKKSIISGIILITMIAGAMLISSFTISKQVLKTSAENEKVTDNGWENWTKVTIYPYERKNGEWIKSRISSPGFFSCQVQRREWCGEKEYRICLWENWYPVTKSPVSGYRYAFYGPQGKVYCFDM